MVVRGRHKRPFSCHLPLRCPTTFFFPPANAKLSSLSGMLFATPYIKIFPRGTRSWWILPRRSCGIFLKPSPSSNRRPLGIHSLPFVTRWSATASGPAALLVVFTPISSPSVRPSTRVAVSSASGSEVLMSASAMPRLPPTAVNVSKRLSMHLVLPSGRSERSISLSDGDRHTAVEESASPEYLPPSPIGPDMALNNSPGLSPIEVCAPEQFLSLSKLISEMSVTVPMTPPSSPHPSLPELISASNSSESTSSERSPSPLSRVPIVFRRSSENQRSARVRRTLPPPGQRIGYQREFLRVPRSATPMPTGTRFVPLPRTRPVVLHHSPETSFVGDSRESMQRFTASPANASASSGNFKPLLPKKTRRGRRGQGRKIKAAIAQAMAAEEHRRFLEENRTRTVNSCHFCSQRGHFIRQCPSLAVVN
ncbi:hypothetical protein C8F01DRAFT_1234118 [Mycena amicta]|nr:hypothetical protein C8F01DRAFT_1234118 [Mycena amicta]